MFSRIRRNANQKSSRKRTRYCRPRFEALEARRVLATYFVDTLSDTLGGVCAPDNASGNSACSIRDAMLAAQNNPGADRIEIPTGTYLLSQGALSFNIVLAAPGEVAIVGTGNGPADVVIDGSGGGSRVFELLDLTNASSVSFSNMTLRNGIASDSSDGGGAISADLVDVAVDNVIFSNNSSIVSNTSFVLGVGGAISTNGNLSVTDSIFQNNSADDSGGAVYFAPASNDVTLSIASTSFLSNTAGVDGGAIYADGDTANGATVSLSSTTFAQNTSDDSGGGVFIYRVTNVVVSDSVFTENEALGVNSSDGVGGGLYIRRAFDNGSGGGARISNSTFNANTSFTAGAGAFIANSSTTVVTSSFDSNSVLGNGTTFETGGGGLAVQSDELDGSGFATSFTSLSQSNIRGNSAPAGGGASVVNGTLRIIDSDIIGNTATEASTGGGGIGAFRNASRTSPSQLDVSVTTSKINSNTTAGAGGGIGALDASVFITDSTIDQNVASGGPGGGLGSLGQFLDSQLTVQRSTVSNNSSSQDGGGLGVIDSQLTVFNATISNNSAANTGGGIAYQNSNTSFSAGVTASTIASNSAGLTGSNVAVASSVMRFLSTIIADPQGTSPAANFVSFPGTIASQGFNLVSDNSSSFASATDLVNTDPLLGSLADNGGPVLTRALLAGSPAIDAGSGTPIPIDTRGLARPVDGDGDGTPVNDIGSFELQSAIGGGGVVANIDNVTTLEDTSIDIDVAANDTGGPLTISIESAPTFGTASIVGGIVRYVPIANAFGIDSFFYRAQNNAGDFDLAEVTVTITPVNDPPIAFDDAFSATNDQPLTISFSSLLANDSPGPGEQSTDFVTFVSAGQPVTGSVSIQASTLIYTPQAGFVGGDTFSYTIIDDGGRSSTGAITIDVSDPGTSLPATVILSTGNGEADLTVTVDGYGSFGTSEIGGAGALFDPIGPVAAATTVFRSFNAFRNSASGPNTSLSTRNLDDVPIQATATTATSSFTVAGFQIGLTQTVQPRFDAAGLRVGAELVQTYNVMNVSAVTDTFDVTRYIDGDLAFDGSISDGGGVLAQPDGNLVLFETDRGGTGATDTTFVGIRSVGGIQPTTERFEIDFFSSLATSVLAGATLGDTVIGDNDGDGFVDDGAESDVALALRRLLTIPVGGSSVYETMTLFGQRPDQIIPQNPGSLSGHVYCDANGNGVEDSGEATADAIVFIDTNGNRLLDAGELNVRTNSLGDYQFASTPSGQTIVALILPSTCHGLPTQFGTVASSVSIGVLPRDLEAADFDGDGDVDLLVASDISNTLTILGNVNGVLSESQTIHLDSRPQAVAAMSPGSSSTNSGPAFVAVAAFGSPITSSSNSSVGSIDQRAGFVYRIQGASVEPFRMGNGPIDVSLADFNKDGLPDIVSAASRSSDFHLLLGGSMTPRLIGSLDNAISVTTGDFNGDGDQDIAMAGYGRLDLPSRDRLPGQVQVLLGDGAGGFTDAGLTISFTEPVDLRSADLNASGGDELIVLGYLGELAVFSLGSSGVVQTTSLTLAKGVRKIEVGELNRDGLLDVAIVNPSNEVITLLRGDGAGGLVVTKELRPQAPNPTRAPADIVFGTFRDGADDELAVAYIYREKASGGFDAESSTTLVRLGIGQASVVVSSTASANVDFTPTTRLDVDSNQIITAADALAVIAEMNATLAEGEHLARRTTVQTAADVNRDGYISAVDALMIINYLNLSDLNEKSESEQSTSQLATSTRKDDLTAEALMLELLIEDQLRLKTIF